MLVGAREHKDKRTSAQVATLKGEDLSEHYMVVVALVLAHKQLQRGGDNNGHGGEMQ